MYSTLTMYSRYVECTVSVVYVRVIDIKSLVRVHTSTIEVNSLLSVALFYPAREVGKSALIGRSKKVFWISMVQYFLDIAAKIVTVAFI